MQFDNVMTKPNLVSNEQKTNSKKVQLVFPKSKGIDVYLPKDLSKYSGSDFFQLSCADICEIEGWFENFTTDSIELCIDSIIQTEHETRLIVGGKEEGRLRVVIRPKNNRHNNNLDQLDNKLHSMSRPFAKET
jgi:hypothetical protein